MKIFNVPRRSGKTTICVNWMKTNKHHVLLVSDEQRRKSILTQYRLHDTEYAERVVTPFTLHTLRGKSNFFMGKGKIVIDEADAVLAQMLGMEVEAITYTEEESSESFEFPKRHRQN